MGEGPAGRGRDQEWGAVAAITVKAAAAAVRAEDKDSAKAWGRVEDKVPARANARVRRT